MSDSENVIIVGSGPAGYTAAYAAAQPVAASASNRGFYRSPLRTFLFALLASNAYVIWWAFQLLDFARRDRTARFTKRASAGRGGGFDVENRDPGEPELLQFGLDLRFQSVRRA